MLRLAFTDPFATSHLFAIPDDVEDPQAAMVRPRDADFAVLGQRQPASLGDLLQRGLGIRESQGPLVEIFQIIGELVVDEIQRSRPSAIENDRADHCLEEILEESRSFPPRASSSLGPRTTQPSRPSRAARSAKPFRSHQMDSFTSQQPLIVLRKFLEEDLRDSMPDDGVAEELEPLIRAFLLRRQCRPVSQRTSQQVSIFESVTEEFLERRKSVVVVRRHACIVQMEC